VRARGSLVREGAMGTEPHDDWRWKARRVLSRFGARTIPALMEGLSLGEDPSIRHFAADSLGRLGAGLDRAIMHRVATATMRCLLRSVAEALVGSAPVGRSAKDASPGWQPAPEPGMP